MEAVVGVALVAGLLVWIIRGRNQPDRRQQDSSEDLSYEEMEARRELRQAEDDVRRRDTQAQPDDDEPGDDWGPGTPRAY